MPGSVRGFTKDEGFNTGWITRGWRDGGVMGMYWMYFCLEFSYFLLLIVYMHVVLFICLY